MNKRRRHKAKAKRAVGKRWKNATAPFWAKREAIPPLSPAAYLAAMHDLWKACAKGA